MNKRKYLAIVIISSFLMTGFLFIWAGEVSYIRIVDVTFGVGAIFIGVSWLLIISNYGLLDIAVYGTRRFWLVLLGKKESIESNYFEYSNNREKLVKYSYQYIGYVGLFYFIVSMILYFIKY